MPNIITIPLRKIDEQVELDLSRLSDEVVHFAMFHGFNQKFNDAGAGQDDETFRLRVVQIRDALYQGVWSRGGGSRISPFQDALRGVISEAAQASGMRRSDADKMAKVPETAVAYLVKQAFTAKHNKAPSKDILLEKSKATLAKLSTIAKRRVEETDALDIEV